MNSPHRLDTVVIHGIALGRLSALGSQAARAAHLQHVAASRLAPTPADIRTRGDGEGDAATTAGTPNKHG